MASYATGASGLVRVVANVSSIVQFLPAEIKSFLGAHPHIQVRLEEKVSPLVTKAVAENSADVGIFTVVPHGYPLETFPYHVDRLVVVTPRAHPLGTLSEISFAQTLAYDYVGLHSDSAINLQLSRNCCLRRWSRPIQARAPSLTAIRWRSAGQRDRAPNRSPTS